MELQILQVPGQTDTSEPPVGHHDDRSGQGQDRPQDRQEPFFQGVLAAEELPLLVTRPRQRQRPSAERQGRHQDHELADVHPVHENHDRLGPTRQQAAGHAGHCVRRLDAGVAEEAVGPLDAVFGGDRPRHRPTQGGQSNVVYSKGRR